MAISSLRAALWAICGATVVLFIFFAALGGIDPAGAQAATIAIGVLGALWLVHSWRRLWSEEASSPVDRERRGF